MANRIGGTIYFKVNGEQFLAKGNFTYNLGKPKREAMVGADVVHGYKEMPQVPYIEGEISDASTLNLETFLTLNEATVTLELANGKVIVLRDAFYAGDGEVGTEEGNIQARFEGISAEEVR